MKRVAPLLVIVVTFWIGVLVGVISIRLRDGEQVIRVATNQSSQNCSGNISGNGNESSMDCSHPAPCTGAATATGDGSVANTGVIRGDEAGDLGRGDTEGGEVFRSDNVPGIIHHKPNLSKKCTDGTVASDGKSEWICWQNKWVTTAVPFTGNK